MLVEKKYREKLKTIDEILGMVKSDMNIVTGLGAAEAREFLSRLHTLPENIQNINITNCLPMGVYEFYTNPKYKERFFLDGWFYSGGMRKHHHHGNISFVPNHLHLAGTKRLFNRKPNIYIGNATPVDKHGYVSLSLSNVYEKKVIEEADIVILEINPNLPRTFGDVELKIDEVDFFYEANYEIPELPLVPFTEKDEIIGKLIAEYVEDGDCIQLGIGGIPNAVAASLKGKKDLGIHTEMITDGMVDLVATGVITGKKKNIYNGKLVGTFALGTKRLYEFLDENPSVLIKAGDWVNDPCVIGQNDNMVSINTTLEIDLTGQCCSESIGHRQFSGTGGQSDTAVGAQKSKNGKSFIALYSTAMVTNPVTGEKEEISKIVPFLKLGAIVSLSRNDVDYVVTEYGMVSLRGTSVKERVDRLISIAHPKFRDELYVAAKKNMIW